MFYNLVNYSTGQIFYFMIQALPEVEEKVSKLEHEAASLDAVGEVF